MEKGHEKTIQSFFRHERNPIGMKTTLTVILLFTLIIVWGQTVKKGYVLSAEASHTVGAGD